METGSRASPVCKRLRSRCSSPIEGSALYEMRANRTSTGRQGYIDALVPGKLAIEMKSEGGDLAQAERQALDYLNGLSDAEMPVLLRNTIAPGQSRTSGLPGAHRAQKCLDKLRLWFKTRQCHPAAPHRKER